MSSTKTRESSISDVPAVDRTLDILERLSARPEGQTLSELSGALELPTNAVFRIMGALKARGYVDRDESSKRFTLTGKFLTITQPRFQQKSLVEVSLPSMRELRDITRETVQLGVLCGAEGVILEQVESSYPLRIVVDVGLRFALYNNAPGKLLLAHLPEHERTQMIRSLELAPCTRRTITDKEELLRECERIVQQGYSTDYGEADEGIHCVAAPVYGRHNRVEAALWISGPSRRLPKDCFEEKAQSVMAAARQVSARLQ
ncbi:MAG TPA: IclR family transcriptional regulator [Planctomycetota bacterium]|nr:IclR family transcriptional regulator [Planctomycetota bacterium]